MRTDEQNQRLDNLIAILSRPELPEGIDIFDMAHWGSKTDCGTAACAMGCYAVEYPDRFRLDVQSNTLESVVDTELVMFKRPFREEFGIDTATAIWLFDWAAYEENCDISRADVLARVQHIRNGGTVENFPNV